MMYSYEENLIRVADDTKDELIERTSFLDNKDFVSVSVSQTRSLRDRLKSILWVDWMSPVEFDEVANVLGIEY